jgi:fatty acid-binding protein DegV
MKIALLVDSTCALPAHIRNKYDVFFVPVDYVVDDENFTDSCETADALALFESGALSRKHEVFSHAPSAERFEEHIIEVIGKGYDCVLVQTASRFQDASYENANSAAARVKQQLDGRQVVVKIMDSRTVLAGQAMMATETLRRLLKIHDESVVWAQMNKIADTVQTFVVPKDPLVALERACDRNENNVGWTHAMVANIVGLYPVICDYADSSEAVAKVWGFKKAVQKMFQHAENCIDAGLTCPIITVHIAGATSALESMPGYNELVAKAKSKKMMVIPSVASLTAGARTSVGSISVALATKERNWSV